MKSLKIFAAVVLSLSTILMTGCWNYREIESLSIVAGVGIDEGKNGMKFHLTFDMVDMSSKDSSGGTSPKSKTIETEGKTIFDAIRNGIRVCGKKLFFSDCKVLIIGSKVAEKGIKPVVDFFSRDAEVRRNIKIYVSKGKPAKDLLKIKPVAETIVSYEFDKINKADKKSLGKESAVSLYEANNMISKEGMSLSTAALEISPLNPDSAEFSGVAVFKKDKLIGYVGSEESRYLQILMGKSKGGLLILDDEDDIKGVTIEIYSCKTSIQPIISGENIKVKINIKMKAALAENETSEPLSSESRINDVEKLSEKTLKRHISEIIEMVRKQYDSDIFGFGNAINRAYCCEWKTIKSDWDKQFKTIGYDIDAKVMIKNSATKHREVGTTK